MKLLLLFLMTLSLPAAEVTDLKVGSRFPGYALENIASGEKKSVRSYFGKKTILHVFASW